MAYIVIADLNAQLPEEYRIKAVDDERTGEPSAADYAAILDAASDEVDSYLSALFTVPVSPIPAIVKRAAVWFALELLYGRRNVENKQVKERAGGMRAMLNDIRTGSVPISNVDSVTTSFDTWHPLYNDEALALMP